MKRKVDLKLSRSLHVTAKEALLKSAKLAYRIILLRINGTRSLSSPSVSCLVILASVRA